MKKLIFVPLLAAIACSSGTGYIRSPDPIPPTSGLVIVTTGYTYEYRNSISTLAPLETDARALSLRHLDVGPRCGPGDATITLNGPGGSLAISSDGLVSLATSPPRYSAAAFSSTGGYGSLVENRDIFTFMLPAGKYTFRLIECEPPSQDSRGGGMAGLAVTMAQNMQLMKTAIAQRIDFEVKPGTITHLGQIEVGIKATRTGTSSVDRSLTVKTSAGLTEKEIREELLRGRMADFPIHRAAASSGPVQNVSS